jgi:8-oxo-dGTP pyrophosphatase MutT (NUDIX family)
VVQNEGSIVILFDRDGRLLLQQRDDDVPPAGYGRWAVPGGGREGTESPRETALREFAEETGVTLQRLRFYRTIQRGAEELRAARTLHVFFADDDIPESAIQCFEGLCFAYHAPADIPSLPMNGSSRAIIDEFLASDKYRGTLAISAPYKVGVGVIEIDRWGRLLLQLRDADLPPERYPDAWSMPGGILEPGEAPDAGALREFEEETGQLLEDLKFFRLYRRDPDLPTSLTDLFHIYYVDADLDEDLLEVNEGQAFKYWAPNELAALNIPPHARRILDDFLADAAYRAMFH